MDHTHYARVLMGDSLGFHIIFALLGVGIPLLVCLAHLIGLLRKDPDFLLMARRWSLVMVILFVAGAISGTIISFQFSTLWAPFMEVAGRVIGLPFYFEGFAFFIEAIFLGIYVYGWGRIDRVWWHWLASIPIVLGAAASAFFITTANAFMNNPQGFVMKGGKPTEIHPWSAMFNPATATETSHSILSYYLTATLAFAGVYAIWLLRRRTKGERRYGQKILTFLLPLALVFGALVGLSGDRSAKYLAREEPLKLAAAEGQRVTQAKAPLRVGGVVQDGGGLKYAIEVPLALSFLAFGQTNAVVKGLDAFDPKIWPPLYIHYLFDLMVGVGIVLVLIPLVFVGLWFWRRRLAFGRAMLMVTALSGVLGFVGVEAGWMLTEIGRQPYAIRGVMTTEQAFAHGSPVMAYAVLFPLIYLALGAATVVVLRLFIKRRPLELSRGAGD